MKSTVEELLAAIDEAMSLMKGRGAGRYVSEVDNLLRVKKVLERLDPDEVEALLEDDEDEEE
ncbi:MAG TPA: hypothetical protein VGS03_08875 [Candidatus Polarisedimenticolia bacterium]|jgi:hypothetical protein|nr:hypothetical protein [Candidatus Polarisedimenticolia bacterium]